MSIQQHVVLRYRAPGHVRFAIPPSLCEAGTAKRLRGALAEVEGVYRVDVYVRQGKLSVRYIEGVCEFRALLSALETLVMAREAAPAASREGREVALAVRPVSGLGNWLRAKVREVRETVTAATVVARRAASPNKALANGEKFAIEFFTDALVLYLIKLHWHMITQHWLKRPWQYRYEWMAAWYLIFLLVRSKKPKA